MPIEIERDGKKITVYTVEEHQAALAGARTGLLSEDEAKRRADTAAAAARREAEQKVTELQAELAKGGKSAEELAKLQQQLAEQAGKITAAERTVKGLRVLVAAGVSVAAAEQLLGLPLAAAADFDSEGGQKKALEGLKAAFPFAFPQGDGQAAGEIGAGGQGTGQGGAGGQAAGAGATGNGQGNPTGQGAGAGSGFIPLGGSAGGAGGGQAVLNSQQLGAMTPDQVNANWEQVQASMAAIK